MNAICFKKAVFTLIILSSTTFAGDGPFKARYNAWVEKHQGTASGANGGVAAGANGAAVKPAGGPLTVLASGGRGFICTASQSSLLVVGQGDAQVAIFCDVNNCTTVAKNGAMSTQPITEDAKAFLLANCP